MNIKTATQLAIAIASMTTWHTAALAQASPAQQRAVLAQIKAGGTSIVKDATFTSDRMLKVGVIDDHTPRDGLAQAMCEELAEQGARNMRVQVIDIAKLVRTDKWVKLGEAGCK
jgi:hypothetical protein